jgi:hypothetical protein
MLKKKLLSHYPVFYFKLDALLKSLKAILYARNLDKLAIIFLTDKATIKKNKKTGHGYSINYSTHFQKIRKNKIKLLEIGIGGHTRSDAGGNSLRMWKRYFKKGRIYGVDIYDKKRFEEKRIKIFQGDQNDVDFLKNLYKKIGSIDIIIDDGSHVNEHVITSFTTLFPLLNNGGIYAIEDTHTSYMSRWGGGGYFPRSLEKAYCKWKAGDIQRPSINFFEA